ncbi:MAG: aminoacetone oxidase family FAD-binding enzyme [Gemmatimonadaceae bacterium]
MIVGAGAAGSMAAIFAARHAAEVTLLESTRDGGRKILISGGGRCNVLPMLLDESRFVTDSSRRSLGKILRSWSLADQIRFFEHDIHIPLAEEPESAKLFPRSNKARDVRDGLLTQAREAGASVRNDARVTGFDPVNDRWVVSLENQPSIECDAVIIATGGLSVPNTGSDGLGLTELARLGHATNPAYAALTPITATDSAFAILSGVSLRVTITARDAMTNRSATATGGFLFTHRGYSGPSVLDVSHVLVRSRIESNASARIEVQWTELDAPAWEFALRPQGARTVAGAVRIHLPSRLADVLLNVADCDPARSLSELRRDERHRVISVLTRCELPWDGDEGYRKAEVTGGGVSLAEVNPVSMESRLHPGLYICGEVLDAFGPVGGYNFLWAWTTGRAAGVGAAT